MWEHLGVEVVGYLLPVIAALLTAFISWCLVGLAKRLGIEVAAHQRNNIIFVVRLAIYGAEEWAHRELKSERPVTGAEKTAWVKSRVLLLYPDLIPEDLNAMIDEELGRIRGDTYDG